MHSARNDVSSEERPTALVFAPTPLLTVTIETLPSDVPELHVHPGGQGFWIARMATTLGLQVCLCGAFGGETGPIVQQLITAEGIAVRGVHVSGQNGSYVHDRRSGERRELAAVPSATLDRHEADDLFHAAFSQGLETDVAILGGPHDEDAIPDNVYARLAADLSALGIPVVADLSGPSMTAALEGGLHLLKVSHEDMINDGRARSGAVDELTRCMQQLHDEGAKNVVMSRAGDPALALLDGELWEVIAPPLKIVDHRGAGDSMTAGISAAIANGSELTQALRLGAAAGAVNITRHGLATGEHDLVIKVAEAVQIRPLTAEKG